MALINIELAYSIIEEAARQYLENDIIWGSPVKGEIFQYSVADIGKSGITINRLAGGESEKLTPYLAVKLSNLLNEFNGNVVDKRILFKAAGSVLIGAALAEFHPQVFIEGENFHSRDILERFSNGIGSRDQDEEQGDTKAKARIGQIKFKSELMVLHNGKCAVTGCDIACVLHGAHIRPYSEHRSYPLDNGILLRSDVHALFDKGLLKIRPDDSQILVDESISHSSYGKYHGQKLANRSGIQINSEYLRLKYTPTPKKEKIENVHPRN